MREHLQEGSIELTPTTFEIYLQRLQIHGSQYTNCRTSIFNLLHASLDQRFPDAMSLLRHKRYIAWTLGEADLRDDTDTREAICLKDIELAAQRKWVESEKTWVTSPSDLDDWDISGIEEKVRQGILTGQKELNEHGWFPKRPAGWVIEGWSLIRRRWRDGGELDMEAGRTGCFQWVRLGADRIESERIEAWLGEEIKAKGRLVLEDLFSEPAIFAMPELLLLC